jgi:hypothetical protein
VGDRVLLVFSYEERDGVSFQQGLMWSPHTVEISLPNTNRYRGCESATEQELLPPRRRATTPMAAMILPAASSGFFVVSSQHDFHHRQLGPDPAVGDLVDDGTGDTSRWCPGTIVRDHDRAINPTKSTTTKGEPTGMLSSSLLGKRR